MLLKGTLGVFPVVCCQCELCARGNLQDALGFAAVFSTCPCVRAFAAIQESVLLLKI